MKAIYLLAIATLAATLMGCFHNADAYPPNYTTEGLYCWHRSPDQKWAIIGMTDQCPPNTKPMSDEVVDPAP